MVRAVLWTLLIFLGCHWRAASAEASTDLPLCYSGKCGTSRWSSAEGLLIFAQASTESESVADSDTAPTTTRRKLDRHTRIELLFILVMLVAVGMGLIAFTWLTARLTRRYMKPSEKLPARRPDPAFTDDWASKPLTEQERSKLDSSDW